QPGAIAAGQRDDSRRARAAHPLHLGPRARPAGARQQRLDHRAGLRYQPEPDPREGGAQYEGADVSRARHDQPRLLGLHGLVRAERGHGRAQPGPERERHPGHLALLKEDPMFFRGSRYEPVPTAMLTTPEGRVIPYKRIRFIPDTPGMLPYTVLQGDRLD